MTTALGSRRRVALRLLALEAGLLAGILAGFALLAAWHVGTAPLETLLILGAALLGSTVAAEWAWVRRDWKRMDADFGGGRAP